MAVAKDGCGLGELASGNGRRLHLGIPEAVFVVRDMLVLGILTLGRDRFLPSPHPGLVYWGIWGRALHPLPPSAPGQTKLCWDPPGETQSQKAREELGPGVGGFGLRNRPYP